MPPPYRIDDWRSAVAEKRQALQDSIPLHHRLPDDLRARAERDELLPSDQEVISCGILTPLDVEITKIDDAPILVELIAARRYSAVDVTEAFCKRLSIAHQTTNCATEMLYERALERAQWLDAYQEKEGKTVGILHGLPVSLKVCIDNMIFLDAAKGLTLTSSRMALISKVSLRPQDWFRGYLTLLIRIRL